MIAHLLLVSGLLAGATEAGPIEAAPALRTDEVVRQEMKAEGDALRSGVRSIEEATRLGTPPGKLESLRLAVQRHRIRRGQLHAELDEIRETDTRLQDAGLDGDRLDQVRERLAAFRAEREAARADVAAARLELTMASSRQELSEAEAHLTRAERALSATRRQMEELLQEHVPEF